MGDETKYFHSFMKIMKTKIDVWNFVLKFITLSILTVNIRFHNKKNVFLPMFIEIYLNLAYSSPRRNPQ